MMYNRYIPQPDGSHSRRRVPEPKRPQPQHPSPPPPEPPCEEPPVRNFQHPGVGSFLHQLLPKDFDTGDLIVILLLLLMAGDSAEDRNNAILTIALYFLM